MLRNTIKIVVFVYTAVFGMGIVVALVFRRDVLLAAVFAFIAEQLSFSFLYKIDFLPVPGTSEK
jgi:hypothetical protein